jgi:hypothetical protein
MAASPQGLLHFRNALAEKRRPVRDLPPAGRRLARGEAANEINY